MATRTKVGRPGEHINSVWAASDLQRRAQLQRAGGRVNNAIDLLEEALRIRRTDIPGTEYDVLDELGKTYTLSDHLDKADKSFASAVALIERDFYADHPLLAPILEHWSSERLSSGDLEHAAELAQRALGIRLKSLLPQDVHTLESMRSLAEILRRLQRYPEAETLLRQAIKLLNDSTIGPVEEFNYELALLYEDQGRYQQAEELFGKALDLFVHRSGKSDRFATCLKSYATLLRATGRGARADQLDMKAQAIIYETTKQPLRQTEQNMPGRLLFTEDIYACSILQ
jgi:tetratricopeptide (TPR) repeat protein